jgi:hypothetical protein
MNSNPASLGMPMLPDSPMSSAAWESGRIGAGNRYWLALVGYSEVE